MAGSPQLKVYSPQGEYVAACKVYEDAAMLVGGYGEGATVRYGHNAKRTIWHEGYEVIEASQSYDAARIIMMARVNAIWRREPA